MYIVAGPFPKRAICMYVFVYGNPLMWWNNFRLLLVVVQEILYRGCIYRETWGMLELTITLPYRYSLLRSSAFHTDHKGKMAGLGRFLLFIRYICICLLMSITCFFISIGKGRAQGRGRKRVGSWLYVSMDIFNGAWATPWLSWLLPLFIADFNSRKRT